MTDVKISVRNNGPLKIEGENIQLLDQEGRAFGLAGRTGIALCRCGHSENKPFCDGTHNRMQFVSEVVAKELPPPKPKV